MLLEGRVVERGAAVVLDDLPPVTELADDRLVPQVDRPLGAERGRPGASASSVTGNA